MNGGIGDMLLLTIIFRKIFEESGEKIITISAFKEIFLLNKAVQKVYRRENQLINFRRLVGFDYHDITYRCWSNLLPTKKNVFNSHAIEQFCHQLGPQTHAQHTRRLQAAAVAQQLSARQSFQEVQPNIRQQ